MTAVRQWAATADLLTTVWTIIAVALALIAVLWPLALWKDDKG